MTLDEVNRIPQLHLWENHNFIDYPHVQDIILREYGQQEIAYSTPDLFKRKLNYELSLRVQNYNKMFRSQLIEIDPFVTEYIESMTDTSKEGGEHEHSSDIYSGLHTGLDTRNTKAETTENYTESADKDYNKQNSGVESKSTLLSESENKDTTTTESGEKSYTSDENTTQNVQGTATTDKTETVDKTLQHNQTARKWTEQGSSKGHNLDVHSDTPQAMLFNVPNHYYGTGRADDYGEVVKDSQGNYVYQHYAETNPDTIDSANLEIGGGDSPWYNYATTADNKTGHDSYDKSGTETFNQSDTGKDSTVANDKTDTTETTNIQKGIDGNEEYSKNIQTDESTARNSNEHSKNDTHTDEDYTESSKGIRDTTTNQTTGSITDTSQKDNTKRDIGRKQDYNEKTSDRSYTKGRRMMNPSKLLQDYRETLTFNCDMWLISELEPLFIQIF